MPFTDLPEGQTHSENDGCGMPEHNMTTPKTVKQIANELIDNVTYKADEFAKDSEVILSVTAKQLISQLDELPWMEHKTIIDTNKDGETTVSIVGHLFNPKGKDSQVCSCGLTLSTEWINKKAFN